ncbi:aminotransferase class V-fold PLP-dependent enzyme [Bradyrhizobium sp. CB82]|uniref:aminotransferase class V-fold PLP-dependent enzyme n=1 Tax=Bradyrhizobium sp. CB82 TaxID=3039159 RepID=UPI0024B25356|nr:aminotransferase class V-fold PLP-dependent enzyme [Bradyrhizobium sp. CB82]WFU40958.1 aminotransferase class V-fold PLP-dependent enzyme [Bradyrhizobium sp. CB82]
MSIRSHLEQLQRSRRALGGTSDAAPGQDKPSIRPLGSFPPEEVDWQSVRAHFVLPPGMIYMNSGSEGSMPRPILDRYASDNLTWAQNPSYCFFDSPRFGENQQLNRAAIAKFVGAAPLEIVLTNNTTMGLAMALLGLPLAEGDEILTTDQEHWSLLAPLTLLQKRWNVIFRQLPVPTPLNNAESVVELFRNAVTPRTKVIALSHITWTTGTRFPVEQVCAFARSRGILTVIDGAHALGTLALNLSAIGCDFYACSGHKWLNGPPGTGVLYVRDAVLNPTKLWPILTEYTPVLGQYPISTDLQIRGCNNTPGFAAMVEAAKFDADIGREAIEQHILAMNTYAKRRIVETWGETALFSPAAEHPELSSGMASFVPSVNPAAGLDSNFINAVVSALWSKDRIYVRSTQFPAPPGMSGSTLYAIRASTNIFNDMSEIDTFIDATRTIAASLAPG